MNILVYGAGVIGSVYAARLQEAGYNVSLLARRERAATLRAQGILLENVLTRRCTTTRVTIVEDLAPMDCYNVVIVTVRMDQLTSILPSLAANRQCPTILFLLNNPSGMQRLEMLDPQRVLLGFPSVGGTREEEVVRYMYLPLLMPTILGKEDGRMTRRLEQLVAAFKKAGFSVALNADIQGWLKTHGLITSCSVAAVLMTKGNSAKLGRTRQHVALMVQGIREGLQVLQAQNIPISPLMAKALFLWMPGWFAILCWQSILRSPAGRLSLDPHLQVALEEMRQVGRDVMAQLQPSSVSTPTLNYLMTFLEMPS